MPQYLEGIASGFSHGPRLYQASAGNKPTLKQQRQALYPGQGRQGGHGAYLSGLGGMQNPAFFYGSPWGRGGYLEGRFDVKDRFTGRGGR